MRLWKSESAQELRASRVRRSSAYGYCGYGELRVTNRGPIALEQSKRRVTMNGSVKMSMESTAEPRKRTRVA
jgi:hypothetical protein